MCLVEIFGGHWSFLSMPTVWGGDFDIALNPTFHEELFGC
jgi:hypothetical protein